MKKRSLFTTLLFSFSFFVPTIITSCSLSSESDKNEKDNGSSEGNNNTSSSGSGNGSGDSDNDNKTTNPDNSETTPPSNSDNIEIESSDLHKYPLSFFDNKTPNEIYTNLNSYKYLLAKMNNYLNQEMIVNNDNYFKNSDNKTEYMKELSSLGIYGNFGTTYKEKIKNNPYLNYGPDNFKNMVSKQKYLETFTNSSGYMSLDANEEMIKKLITNNPYGYLPSNVSQYLYLINYNDLSDIFGVSGITDIKAKYDDLNGTISILIATTTKEYLITLNKTNTKDLLKSENDFYQYIYDRTLMITSSLYDYKRSPWSSKIYNISKPNNQGTLWVIDRIKDDNETNYTFLVGTNMHVLSYTDSFDRNSVNMYPSENLKKYWNGGFRKDGDELSTVSLSGGAKYATLTRKTPDKQANIKLGKWNKNNVKDIVINDPSNGQKVNYYENSSINSNQYLDRIFYTPFFHTKGVEADNYSNNELWLTKDGDDWKTDNAGMDFVVTKITIPKNEINNYFPTLKDLIGTEKEKDWYIKLPDVSNNLYVSPNQTFLTAGYPGWSWSGIKSTGSLIQTQNRNIEKDDNVSYWRSYDEKINKERNKDYKFYETDFKNSYNDLPHGMTLTHTIQNSILNLYNDENKFQPGGASGSLTIDSKFNAIGILFSGLLKNDTTDGTDPSNFYSNQISLFNSIGDYEDWNGNIKQDLVKKLVDENIKTISLNN